MLEFFRGLWQSFDRSGALTFWSKQGKESVHVPLRDLETWTEEDEHDLATYGIGRDLYFGLGLRPEGLGTHEQGKKHRILALPGLALDIDFFNPDRPDAHKAKNLPRTIEEAAPILDGLPAPSWVVDTCGGIQVYWFFDKPIELPTPEARANMQRAFKRFQLPIIARAKELGFHLDNTASIQHVWRLLGSTNQKWGREVVAIYGDLDSRYALRELGLGNLGQPAPTSTANLELAVDLELARKMLRRISPKNRFADAIKLLLKGESFAERGARDETMQGIASTVAWFEPFRKADPHALAELFRPALEIWTSEEDAKLTLDEELEKAADKIARSQEDYFHKEAEKRPRLERLAKKLGVKLDPDGDGVDDLANPADAVFYLLIQYKTIFYVWDFREEKYSRALIRAEVLAFINRAWEVDLPDGVEATYVNSKGELKQKTIDRLMKDYGTIAESMIGDMTIESSYYDQKQNLFKEAMAQHRVKEAKFDPRFDDFLQAFAGPHYNKVADWIACVPLLKETSAALCLVGPPGTGKTALANALARLHRIGEPTPLRIALDGFNDLVAQCPVVFADEGLPKRKGISEDLRRLIGSKNFTINEKFMPLRAAVGAVRVIIAANNDRVLSTDEELSVEDLQAYADRYLYIRVQNEAVDWLKQYNSDNRLMDEWIEGDGIAKHCLYLHQTRTVEKTGRFIVSGSETNMHRQLIMQRPSDSVIFEWLARFATDPERLNKLYETKREDPSDENSPAQKPKALIGCGLILVNAQSVLDGWNTYMFGTTRSSTNAIGGALKRLSDGTRKPGRKNRITYHRVRTNLVIEWAREYQIGDEDKIAVNLSKKHPLITLDLDDEAHDVLH